MPVRQLPNIGDVGAQALRAAGLSNFEALLAGDPPAIEVALKRKAPFGKTLQQKVAAVPQIKVRLCPTGTDGSVAVHFGDQRVVQGSWYQLMILMLRRWQCCKINVDVGGQ